MISKVYDLRVSTSRLAAALFIVFCLPAALWAQGATGSITGTVQDSTGAVIPGATVTLTNQATGLSNQTETQADGSYLVANLQPGDYTVAVETEGFKRQEITGLRINAGSTLTQAIALEIGVVTETVEVSGQALAVETTSGQVGSTVQIEQILEMPSISRNVFSLVNLVPGAFYAEDLNNPNATRVSLGGGRTQSASAMVDGVNNTRGGLGVQNVEMSPPIDAMQEFKVEVNNLGAEYGRSSAGVINAVTKSGTNEFHGSFYEFLRNDKLDAAGWNNDVKPSLRRNNFGGTFGGPIVKNRTFFFYNLDVLRIRAGVTRTRSVGFPEFQQGDFSRATARINKKTTMVPIYDPDTGSGTFAKPKGTSQFPNNTIPLTRFDPVAAAVVAGNFIPAANRAPNNVANNSGNWQGTPTNEFNRNFHTMKLDHEWTSNTRSFVRYILTTPDEELRGYTQGYGAADQNGLAIKNKRQNLALNLTHLFSPTFILNATAGFNRVFVDRKTGDCCDTNYAAQFGLSNESIEKGGEVFPRFNHGGGLVPVNQIGAVGNAHRDAVFTNFDYILNFTKTRGSHTFKFGTQFSAFQGNELSRPSPSGIYGFNGRWTQQYNAKGKKIKNTGIRYADFLLGRLNSVDSRVAGTIGKRIKYYSGYFQDDWRVSSTLTINLGIRYEFETPITEVADRMNNFDLGAPHPLAGQNGIPEGAIGVVTFPNRNGVGKYLWRFDKNNVSPRFGFAWRVFGSDTTVIRGGFGIFYGNPYDRNAIQPAKAGFDKIYIARHPVPFRLQDGVPAGALADIPESELLPTFGSRGTRFATSQIEVFDPNRVTPYTENFNLTIAKQLKGMLFELGYLGNLGRHIAFPGQNINLIRPEDLPRLDPDHPNHATEYQLRPWQGFTSNQPQVQMRAPNWGLSNAHLITFKAERRYQNGFGFTVAYTHTQWIDNLQFTGGGLSTFGDNDRVQNIYNLKGERSRSTNGIPHRVVIAPIIDLPFGRGHRWGSNWGGIPNAILGGWQFSTIATIRSGAPFGVVVQNGPRDYLGDSAAQTVLRPDLASSQLLSQNKGEALTNGDKGLAWLNPDAFAFPDDFTHGNASRTLPGVLGPGRISFDTMVAKNVRWGEDLRVQFRWEMFNALNTPQFGLPNQNFGNSAFGQVGGAGGRRIMQFGLKLYF